MYEHSSPESAVWHALCCVSGLWSSAQERSFPCPAPSLQNRSAREFSSWWEKSGFPTEFWSWLIVLVVFCSAAGLGECFSRTRMFVCILSRTKSLIMEHVCGFTQEDSTVFPFVSFSPRLTCSRHCWEMSSRTWSFPEGSRKKRLGRECCTETSQWTDGEFWFWF